MTIKNKGVLSILLAGTFLSTTATAADGVYTIEEGSVNNYNFTMKEPDGNGNLVTKYYKIVLNPENFSNPEKVKWETAEAAGENTIEVNIPNETKYFKYTYTKPDTYLEANENIDDTLASANVTGVVFNGMSEGNHGGAINNSQDNSSVTITADFIGNQASDNSRNYGGAIYNSGTIGNINGDFIGNFLQDGNAYGGAIFNEGTIGNINGNFIGNKLISGYSSYGGGGIAINFGTINSINGNFINNYVLNASGGAISLSKGNIGSVIGDFIGNYAQSISDIANGGVIADAYIDSITGNFISNHAQSVSGTAQGGVIYNSGSIGDITGNFISNYALSESTNNLAQGGAIFTTNDMTFTTQGKTLFMSGNYTEDNVRYKNYNALFVESWDNNSLPTITFDTTGGGAWIINDNIEGGKSDYPYTSIDYSTHYNLAFKGDDTIGEDGKTTQYVAINNDIINANEVSVEGTTLRFSTFDHGDDTAENSKGYGAFIPGETSDVLPTLTLTNAAFDIYNGYIETINLDGLVSTDAVSDVRINSFNVSLNNNTIGSGFLHIDVDVDNLKADVLNINGDVSARPIY